MSGPGITYPRTGTDPYAPRPSFTPCRRPGATLKAPAPRDDTHTDMALLERVLDGLRRYDTGPMPAAPRTPSVTEDLARYRLAGIVHDAGRHAEPPCGQFCPDCRAADGTRCPACEARHTKAQALYRLHNLILAADSYAAAAQLVAEMGAL